MKKFLTIAAIGAITLVACNNDGESTETTDSSSTTITTDNTTIPVTTDTSSMSLDTSSMNTTTTDSVQQ